MCVCVFLGPSRDTVCVCVCVCVCVSKRAGRAVSHEREGENKRPVARVPSRGVEYRQRVNQRRWRRACGKTGFHALPFLLPCPFLSVRLSPPRGCSPRAAAGKERRDCRPAAPLRGGRMRRSGPAVPLASVFATAALCCLVSSLAPSLSRSLSPSLFSASGQHLLSLSLSLPSLLSPPRTLYGRNGRPWRLGLRPVLWPLSLQRATLCRPRSSLAPRGRHAVACIDCPAARVAALPSLSAKRATLFADLLRNRH